MNLQDHLEKLKHFRIVAEAGSFLAAADQAHQTQQSLFYTVKKLEEALDCSLFIRSKKGVTLTREGQALLKWTHLIDSQVLMAERELIREKQGLTKLSLAVQSPFFGSLIAPHFKEIKALNGGLDLEVKTLDFSKDLIEEVHTGKSDLSILAAPHLVPTDNVQTMELGTESYCVVKSPKWKFKKGADFRDHPILYIPHAISGVAPNLGHELKQLGLKESPFHLNSFEAIKALLFSDNYIGVLPKTTVYRELQAKLLVSVDVPKAFRSIGEMPVTMLFLEDPKVKKIATELSKLVKRDKTIF